MAMRQQDFNQSKTPYQINAEWALRMQPFAIDQFYSKVWPSAVIVELDKVANGIALILDMGGADKMLRFPDGSLSFLAQRFRRWEYRKYDDFTLRLSSPSGLVVEFQKTIKALKGAGFIVGYYAYGLANEQEDGFARMRILKYREFAQAVMDNKIPTSTGFNFSDGKTWLRIPFESIPAEFFLLNYAEDKSPQGRLF